jgi:hypothetical protein
MMGANRIEGEIVMRGRVTLTALCPHDNHVDYENGACDTGIDHIDDGLQISFFIDGALGARSTTAAGLCPPGPSFDLDVARIHWVACHAFPLCDDSPQTLALVGLVSKCHFVPGRIKDMLWRPFSSVKMISTTTLPKNPMMSV